MWLEEDFKISLNVLQAMKAIKVFSKHIMWPQWEEESLPKGEFVDTGIVKHVFFFTWGAVYEHQFLDYELNLTS